YIIDRVASNDTEDATGTKVQCSQTTYDSYVAWTSGQTSSLTVGAKTLDTSFPVCSNQIVNAITTSYTYDGYGNVIGGDDPNANGGDMTHVGCHVAGQGPFTHCTSFDGSFSVLPTTTVNALNQSSWTGYGVTDATGHGGNASSAGIVAYGATGLVGDGDAAMTLDGSSGEVDTPYLQSSVSSYTVEAWVKTTDPGSNR